MPRGKGREPALLPYRHIGLAAAHQGAALGRIYLAERIKIGI